MVIYELVLNSLKQFPRRKKSGADMGNRVGRSIAAVVATVGLLPGPVAAQPDGKTPKQVSTPTPAHTVTPMRPDLIVTTGAIDGDCNLTGTIANVGSEVAIAAIGVGVDGLYSGDSFEWYMNSLYPGDSGDLDFGVVTAEGSTITLTVDAMGFQPESNETNNTFAVAVPPACENPPGSIECGDVFGLLGATWGDGHQFKIVRLDSMTGAVISQSDWVDKGVSEFWSGIAVDGDEMYVLSTQHIHKVDPDTALVYETIEESAGALSGLAMGLSAAGEPTLLTFGYGTNPDFPQPNSFLVVSSTDGSQIGTFGAQNSSDEVKGKDFVSYAGYIYGAGYKWNPEISWWESILFKMVNGEVEIISVLDDIFPEINDVLTGLASVMAGSGTKLWGLHSRTGTITELDLPGPLTEIDPATGDLTVVATYDDETDLAGGFWVDMASAMCFLP